jgi:hypothetical protein
MTSANGAADLHVTLFAIKMLDLSRVAAARRCLDRKWGQADRPLPSCCNAVHDGSRSDEHADTSRTPAQDLLVARVGGPHGVPRIVHASRQRSRTPPPMPLYTYSANPLSTCAHPSFLSTRPC